MGLFECKDMVLMKSKTQSEHKFNKSCAQTERPRSWIKIGKKLHKYLAILVLSEGYWYKTWWCSEGAGWRVTGREAKGEHHLHVCVCVCVRVCVCARARVRNVHVCVCTHWVTAVAVSTPRRLVSLSPRAWMFLSTPPGIFKLSRLLNLIITHLCAHPHAHTHSQSNPRCHLSQT